MAPGVVSACEPIVPLVVTFGGPNLFARSLAWMGGAVLIKCVAFLFFERELRWYHAIGFMIVGNVVSTIAGIILTLPFVMPALGLFLLPFVSAFVVIPAQRFQACSFLGKFRCITEKQFMVAIVAAMIVTALLWDRAVGIM